MTTPTRRQLLQGAGMLGLGGLTLSLTAGCARQPQVPITGGPVDLQLWTHDPGYIGTFEAAIEDEAIVGGLEFDYSLTVVQAAAGDVLTRTISQASAGRTTPDLLGLVIDQFPRVMTSNIAEELFVDLSDVVSDLGDGLTKTAPYTADGRLYALESDLSVTVQYYRADIFEENGISPDITTWDEWLDAGAELNSRTGAYLGMHPNGDNGSIFNQFFQLLLQRGGSPFDDQGRFTLASQEALDVLTFMQRSIQVGAFTTLTDPYGSAVAGALQDSSLAAIAMPNWYNVYGLQANVPDQEGQWRLRTLPAFSQGGHRATTLGGTGFAVGRERAGTEAALELLRSTYLTPEGQLLRFRTAGYLPTLLELYDDPELVGYEDAFLGGQRVFETYGVAASDLPVFYQNVDLTVMPDVSAEPILRVLNGVLEPEQALAEIVDGYERQRSS